MKNKKYFSVALLVCLLFFGVLVTIAAQKKSQKLSVIFFDVGQGDAILISQGDQQVLIDGGRDGRLLLERLGYVMPFWDRNIETVVISHPDQDHIGGLVQLLGAYEVGSVIQTNAINDSQTFKKLEELITEQQIPKIQALKDVVINFSSGARMGVIYPSALVDSASKETNENSVVIKLSYGENSFLFTGDLPGRQEKELILSGADLKSDVLKVSHHGSKYSSTEEFISAVSPKDAIISVGKNNTYGHPAQEILSRIRAKGANIFRTDEQGTITYICMPSASCMRQ